MLSQTKLAVALEASDLVQLEKLGREVVLEPNATLFRAAEPSGDMHVIISGDLNLYKSDGDKPLVWLGPGDIVGEIGFILKTRRTTEAKAGASGCTLWRLERSLILDNPDVGQMILLTKLFAGLAPYVRVRLTKIVEKYVPLDDLLDNHCDSTHSSIQHMATFLKGKNDWDTVISIWDFVRQIPYRIGFWNIKASRVLQFGFGMCTTKSNLQVALMRACGIEAVFAEAVCPSDSMNAIIPVGYRHILMRKPELKHYFAVAKLDGSWFPCDATYPPLVWNVLDEERVNDMLAPGEPYNPLNTMFGRDPFDFTMFPDLKHVMGKRPFYDADNVEAMNIVLDKVQGPFLQIPEWVAPVQYLLKTDPRAAFQRGYAGIITELDRLYNAIRLNQSATSISDDAPREAVI